MELEELRLKLDASGGLVLVRGEAGVGKSRLVREAVARARSDGRTVVWGRPDQVSRPGPFALVLDLVEGLPDGPALRPEAQALASLLAEADEGARDTRSARRVAARLRGLLAQTGERPIVVFEDLHVADEASQAVIVHLARSAPDDGLSIVATYRSEEVGIAEELERFLGVVAGERLAVPIVLEPLPATESAALARELLGEAMAGRAEWISHTADGIPFYIEELAEAARAGESSVAPAGVPDSISRTVLSRLGRLGAVARHVVSVASLMPGALDPDVLAPACEMDSGTVARALAEAARAGLVEDREERLVFRHALVRETIAESLVSAEAHDLHRRIALAIEQRYVGDRSPHAAVLAHHWYLGRDRDKALGYALEAGERALGLAATHEARLAYELALTCAEPSPPAALAGLGEVAVRDGRFVEARDLFRRAAAGFSGAGRHPDVARALSRAAFATALSAGYDAAFDVVNEALALPGVDEHRVLKASLLAQKGRMVPAGRAQERHAALREAVTLAEELGEHAIRSEALDGLACESYFDDRVAEARDVAIEAARAAVRADQTEAIGRSHNNAALILTACGDYEGALTHVTFARERLSASFGSFGVMFIGLTEALVRWALGQPLAVAHLLAGHDLDWPQSEGAVRLLQTWAAVHTGEPDRAIVAVERIAADTGWDGSAERAWLRPVVHAVMCRTMLEVESARPPTDLCLDAIAASLAHERLVADEEARARVLLARGLVLRGRLDEAADAVTALDRIAERMQAPHFHAWSAEVAVSIEAARDPEARSRYVDAAKAFESFGNVVDRVRCLRLASETGGQQEAVAMLKEAKGLADGVGARLESSRIEAALRARGVRPRAGRPRKDAATGPEGLSAREQEVASLVAAGASNATIAGRLFLSERTVQDHITHALRKLGLSGRAGLAAWAAKRGLV